ncbi:hypothetical protein EI171_16200 [Bradyrhizobium sp. LCT2]|nr:hypothetical protein EI171_16200 [Bradyrhizobium sp. LCT2]
MHREGQLLVVHVGDQIRHADLRLEVGIWQIAPQPDGIGPALASPAPVVIVSMRADDRTNHKAGCKHEKTHLAQPAVDVFQLPFAKSRHRRSPEQLWTEQGSPQAATLNCPAPDPIYENEKKPHLRLQIAAVNVSTGYDARVKHFETRHS